MQFVWPLIETISTKTPIIQILKSINFVLIKNRFSFILNNVDMPYQKKTNECDKLGEYYSSVNMGSQLGFGSIKMMLLVCVLSLKLQFSDYSNVPNKRGDAY